MPVQPARPSKPPPTKIEFVARHEPALPSGDYTVTVTQTIEAPGIPLEAHVTTRNFSVLGDRFVLQPADVHAVFPPPGSLGEFSNVLPHIALNRSTLPWERYAIPLLQDEERAIAKKWRVQSNDMLTDAEREFAKRAEEKQATPWLALLVFHEGELVERLLKEDERVQNSLKIVKLGALHAATTTGTRWPGLSSERGHGDGDMVTVLDVKRSVLEPIMPTARELQYLAHVRRGTDDGDKLVGDELAIIFGNRLPDQRAGATSTVHLVSLEHRFVAGNGFDYQDAGSDELIRLVSLKSWRFACVDPKKDFKNLLVHVNRDPGTVRLPANIVRRQNDKTAQARALRYLASGFVPLPHQLRTGQRTISFYRGPLATAEDHEPWPTFPVKAGDELLRYDAETGTLDVSYAAAWELGRLLALKSKQFSTSLYLWKRRHARQWKQVEQRELHPHLPVHHRMDHATESQLALPANVETWLSNASLLVGVPFNYLVADERMLPQESLRFFILNQLWIACLLDGAFSIGRVINADHERDKRHVDNLQNAVAHRVSGFLLRSAVVAGWPGLQVAAYDLEQQPLRTLRMDRLSPNVLICLFKGDAAEIDLYLKPETLHFGLDKINGSFGKRLRGGDGIPVSGDEGLIFPVPMRRDGTQQHTVVDIDSLVGQDKINNLFDPFTPAQFGLSMIEGVEKVRFVRAPKNRNRTHPPTA